MNTKKFESNVDVAVLFLFFTRTEISVRTFEQIRKARPSKLFLYQDGPRSGREDDYDNIKECRQAIESLIDWNCEVFRLYQDTNYGCDPSEYLSQKWMFSHVEKGIVIEDDDVMSVSFFSYCKELLDRYEDDSRINMICGMNHLGVYEKCPYDYFFVRNGGSIWGWATWKRTIDQWDPSYNFLKDPYAIKNIQNELGNRSASSYLATCREHLASGREHYESILGSYAILNGTYNIVPKRNMTCNIGVDAETTHSVADICKLPRATRKQLYMKTYELSFPLKHPKYVQADYNYWKQVESLMHGNWFIRTFQIRRIESFLYRIFPFLGRL